MIPSESLTDENLINAAKTSLSSKIIGAESDFFAKMCVDAVKSVKRTQESGRVSYPVGAIGIIKVHGKSTIESQLVDGMALHAQRSAQGMPTEVHNAKIALLDFDLKKHRMQMGVKIVVKDPKEIEAIQQREATLITEKIQKILDAGANVILTSRGIDDLCLKMLVEHGVLGVRRVSVGVSG